MSSRAGRLLGVAIGTAVVCALLGIYIGVYLTNASGATAATSTGPGQQQLYLATVPAAALSDHHPTWVSYYTTNPQDTNWKHNTTFVVKAHSTVRITIFQYDSATGLRNEFLGQGTGLVGNSFTLDDKTTEAIDPNLASHVFAIAAWGVNVPLAGISSTAKNPCANAPCTIKQDHTTTTFTIRTPGPGLYRWQCLVPCGAGYIQGFGGPMQTVGYMDGFIKVV